MEFLVSRAVGRGWCQVVRFRNFRVQFAGSLPGLASAVALGQFHFLLAQDISPWSTRLLSHTTTPKTLLEDEDGVSSNGRLPSS